MHKHDNALEAFAAAFREWQSNLDAGFCDYGLAPTDFSDDEIRAVGEISDRASKAFEALRGLSDPPSFSRIQKEKNLLSGLQSSLDEIVLRIGTDEERRSAAGVLELAGAFDRLARDFAEHHRQIERAVRAFRVDPKNE